MKSFDVKAMVTKAIESNWSSFSADHPHLAQAIDQTLLIEQAMDLLEDDLAYRDAMRRASGLGMIADSLELFVERWIGRWLRTLAASA